MYCLGNGDKEKSLQKSNIDTLNPVFLAHLSFFFLLPILLGNRLFYNFVSSLPIVVPEASDI